MSMIGKIAAQAGVTVVETMLVTAANYATNTAIDMYEHPDLRKCTTDEEKQVKIEKFQKTMKVVKPVLNVVEAAVIGAGCGIAIEAIGNAGSKNQKSSVESKEANEANNEAAALIGCNYLI